MGTTVRRRYRNGRLPIVPISEDLRPESTPMASNASAGRAEDVLDLIEDGADLIVPLANGEPVSVARRHRGARRRAGTACGSTRCTRCTTGPTCTARCATTSLHVSYFLSPVTRPAFHARGCELVPNHFSEVPRLLRETTKCSLVLAAAVADGPPRLLLARHELRLRGAVHRAGAVLPRGQRTGCRGPSAATRSTSARSPGWIEVDRPLVEVPAGRAVRRSTERIAALRRRAHPRRRHHPGRHRLDPERAARRPARPPRPRRAHRAALRRRSSTSSSRASSPAPASGWRPGKVVTTFALGTQRALRLPRTRTRRSSSCPVDYVNDPRVIAEEDCFVSINATTEVDLVGQCASETVGGRYWSSSGGQADFARGRDVLAARHGLRRAAVDRRRRRRSRASGRRSRRARWSRR